MNLRMRTPLGRVSAQNLRRFRAGLAARAHGVTMNSVVAAPDLRAGTSSLNRYPSPIGRTDQLGWRPPLFLLNDNSILRDARGIAQMGLPLGNTLSKNLFMALKSTHRTRTERGTEKCETKGYGRACWPVARCWRAVATQPLNRPCSAPVRAPRAPWCWMAMRPRAPLSGLLQTLPIVKDTRRAAKRLTARGGMPQLKTGPSVHPVPVVFLLPMPRGLCPGGQEPEGTGYVQ